MIENDKSAPTEGEFKGNEGSAPDSFWRRPRTKTALLCAGFLVIGLGLGSLATSLAIHRAVRHGLRDPDRLASKVLSHMRSDLDLTDEQAAEILPILQKRFAGLRDAIRREHEAIAGEIETVLTPEQRVIHRQRLEERHERFLGKGRGGEKRE